MNDLCNQKVSPFKNESQLKIFQCDSLKLSEKIQLRDLALQIEDIPNQAEDVADSLAIYVIKRSL